MSWRITLTSDKKIEEQEVIEALYSMPANFRSYCGLNKEHGFSWLIGSDIINPTFNYLVLSVSSRKNEGDELAVATFIKQELEEEYGHTIDIRLN